MVVEGQEVAVVEAMKMQNSLTAPRSGKVKKVHFKVCLLISSGERNLQEVALQVFSISFAGRKGVAHCHSPSVDRCRF